jgi:hypothetical protein
MNMPEEMKEPDAGIIVEGLKRLVTMLPPNDGRAKHLSQKRGFATANSPFGNGRAIFYPLTVGSPPRLEEMTARKRGFLSVT